MKFELTILGSSGAMPFKNRFPTAHVLNIHEQLFLLDCGEGTQMRMSKFKVRKGKIQSVFITHLHGDHIFGLPGLLTSLGMNGRETPLNIYSPPGLEAMINGLFPQAEKGPPFKIIYHELDTTISQLIFENEILTVETIPLSHGIACNGYLFREKKMPRKMIKEKISEYGIPFKDIPGIKLGNDWSNPEGRVIPNNELTLAPPPPRSFAFCTDTSYDERIIPYIKGVDMLYHESTFLEEDADKALATNHSTVMQAAEIAKKAEVGRLILGHYSARYEDLDPHLLEARSIFPASYLGYDGAVFDLPMKKS